MGRIEGKIAVVTGGSSGIGAAVAQLFVEEGARVVVADVNDVEGAAVAEAIGENAIFHHLDVADPAGWEQVLDAAEAAFGPVDVLVQSAAVNGMKAKSAELDLEDYRRTIEINQNGIFYGMHAVIPRMSASGGGSIVNISSAAGMRHLSGSPSAAYTGSKFAVRGLTMAAAIDHARENIRVNVILPGMVLTPMIRAVMDPELMEIRREEKPLGRISDPREQAHAVLFLASDEAGYITGVALPVDGGVLAR